MALRANGQRVPRNNYWRSNAKITDEQRRWKNQTQEPVEQKSQRKLGDKEKRSSSKRENILTMQQEKRETVAPFMMRGTINNKSFEAMIDSGSPVTIFPKKELKEILKVQFLFVTKMPKHEKYVDYNGSQLDLLGVLKGRVEVQGKTIGQARILVSKDGAKAIVGRDWMRQLEYKIQPESERKNNENSILRVDKSKVRKEEKTEKSMDLQQLEEKFPKLFSRRGKFKGIKIKANFTKEMKPTKQRGRRIPVKHQGSVMNEIQRLQNEGHIKKVDVTKENVFIQPTVITVKKDGSVKIAVDARQLNSYITKDKYQMPNVENLMDMIAEKMNENEGEVWFTTLDLRYAYGQIQLEEETARQCNFKIIGGEATGTYRYVNGFYGLTVMPTEFQRVIDKVLEKEKDAFSFIDDILVCTVGTREDHLKAVERTCKRLDEVNGRLSGPKCIIGRKKVEWVGYELDQQGIKPISSKVQGITEKQQPKTLKQLRSYLGAVNQFNRFIPDLAKLCFVFRKLLKKDTKWEWTKEHEEAFTKVNEAVKGVRKLRHFKRNVPLRVICDAGKEGLGAVLQQKEGAEWTVINFASRFLTSLETKYSIHELELLAVVWAVEQFRNYIYGMQFTVVANVQAVVNILKSKKESKTLTSRLTRWVDRLLPFNFEMEEMQTKVMGIADHLLRPLPEVRRGKIQAESLWDNYFTVNEVKEELTNKNSEARKDKPIRKKVIMDEKAELRKKLAVSDSSRATSNEVTRLHNVVHVINTVNSEEKTEHACHSTSYFMRTSCKQIINSALKAKFPVTNLQYITDYELYYLNQRKKKRNGEMETTEHEERKEVSSSAGGEEFEFSKSNSRIQMEERNEIKLKGDFLSLAPNLNR